MIRALRTAAGRPNRHLAGDLLRVLLAAAAFLLLAAPASAQRQATPESAPPAIGYNPNLISAVVLMDKTEYLVGEPLYWDLAMTNESDRMLEVLFYPYYTDDIFCEVAIEGEESFRYLGDDKPGIKQRSAETIFPGERRLFHFRIYYDNERARPHPTRLLFYEPTEAALVIAARYTVAETQQLFTPSPVRVSILEPAARNAECERVMRENNVADAIHRQYAKPEEFELMENLLALYPDTVYAPQIAFTLANGYYDIARSSNPVDRGMTRAAIQAYTALLQVTQVPYIREISLYTLALCHRLLGDDQAFVAWFRKYLDSYGDRGRYNFTNNPYKEAYNRLAEPDPGEYWHFYP